MLRTRSPVYSPLRTFSLDLHVLGTPPAFVLSQDQTLQFTFLATPSLVSLDLEWSAPGLTSLQTSLKALRFRNLLRGLAIRFSKTERRLARLLLRTTDCELRVLQPSADNATSRRDLLRRPVVSLVEEARCVPPQRYRVKRG